MFRSDQQQLRLLLERLDEFERRQVPRHEQAILEVARDSLREAIRELVHRLHDADYARGAVAPWS